MPLFRAVKARSISALNKALDNNPSLIDERDKHGWSPLHYAFALDFPDIAKTLIDRGASLTSKSFENDTPSDIGLIFYSMRCLGLVENDLLDNTKYQTLRKYEFDGIKIRKSLHGREKYLAYAELARKYVRDEKKVKASNYPGPINKELDLELNQNTRRFRNIDHIFYNSIDTNDRIEYIATYITEKTLIANCDWQSAMAYVFCKRVLGLRKVEKFEINKLNPNKLKQLSTLIVGEHDDGDHMALVLGRDEPQGMENYLFWGNNAVVCDPWANANGVYPACEIDEKLNDLISIRHQDGTLTKALRLFNPRTHQLDFSTPQHRVRMPNVSMLHCESAQRQLTHYYDKRKNMSKEEKIQKLKTIAQTFTCTEKHLKEIIEHKEANFNRFEKPK